MEDTLITPPSFPPILNIDLNGAFPNIKFRPPKPYITILNFWYYLFLASVEALTLQGPIFSGPFLKKWGKPPIKSKIVYFFLHNN